MVLQRTIEELKTRPHHERRAFALTIAIAVVGILFLCWVFFFFTSIHASAPQGVPAAVVATTTAQ